MSKRESEEQSIGRIATGIEGLDLISSGGFRRGGIYLVMGKPGAGKTILGNQMCFEHARTGRKALFVTLLTESHARMLAYQRAFDFFDSSVLGTSLIYLSGYAVLEKEGLNGLLDLLRNTLRQHQATLLVLDGFVTAGAMAQNELELKKFIQTLQVMLEMLGCTAVVLTGANKSSDQYPVRTMVDGLLDIRFEPRGMAVVRTFDLVKARGGPILTGKHRFTITEAGIQVYPRLESFVGLGRPAAPASQPRLMFGIQHLDPMLGGGVHPTSVTLELGSSGSGKTALGLSFLAEGVARKEVGLYVGFSETPEELRQNSAGLRPGLSRALGNKLLDFIWEPSNSDLIPDEIGARMIRLIRKRKTRRLFLDGIGRLEATLGRRAQRFFSALCNELRSLGVTTVLSEETRDLFGREIEVPVGGLSTIPDNILLLRHVELRARLHRLISVVKVRGGGADSSLREFSIGKRGIEIAPTFQSAQALLTGSATLQANAGPEVESAKGRRRRGNA